MSAPILWIAGPVQYYEGNYTAFDMAWDFVGERRDQRIFRWRLKYGASSRSFSVKVLTSDSGDQAHASTIRRLYQHAAVLRSDLPAGDIAGVLKAMLPAKEIAFATSLGITGRRHG